MTATMEAPTVDALRFEAQHLARGWLSVALAMSSDDARPALTGLHLEFFEHGARLVATDSYMLLRSWVPLGDATEPGLDEAPLSTATALDPYGRGVGLMRHLLAIATAKDAPPYDVCLHVGDDPREQLEPSLGGLEGQFLIIDVPDQEILTLPLYEGPWPDWRAVWASFEAEKTDEIHFAPELIVGRIGKLGKLHSEGIVRWVFGGALRPALVEITPSEPRVLGLAMPTKVYLPGYAPAGTEPDPASVVDAVVDVVNDGAMGPGWSAERDEDGGVTINVDLDADPGALDDKPE